MTKNVGHGKTICDEVKSNTAIRRNHCGIERGGKAHSKKWYSSGLKVRRINEKNTPERKKKKTSYW